MKEEIEALTRAIQATEEHLATVNRYIDTLNRAAKNARKSRDTPTLRAIQSDLTHYIELRGRLHADRESLSRRLKIAKRGGP